MASTFRYSIKHLRQRTGAPRSSSITRATHRNVPSDFWCIGLGLEALCHSGARQAAIPCSLHTYLQHGICSFLCESGNCCQEDLRWSIQPASALKNALRLFCQIILHHASKVPCRFAVAQSNISIFARHDTNHQSEPD